jgi:peptide/nickel transport system permease protein
LLGLLSGYIGGAVDAIIMRIVDAMLSIPFIVIAIAVAAAIGASIQGTVVIIVVFQWPIYAKQVRAETLSIKEQDFVALAKVAGASNLRIIFKHVLSNVMPMILVLATLHIGELILWESTLSFLGVGVPQPTPTWGTMVSEGKDFITTRWWLSAIPGIAIVLTVVSANMVGDWVRDRLDPRLRQL